MSATAVQPVQTEAAAGLAGVIGIMREMEELIMGELTEAQRYDAFDFIQRWSLDRLVQIEHERTQPRCMVCGCSETRSCEGGCVWATPNLCSRCAS